MLHVKTASSGNARHSGLIDNKIFIHELGQELTP